LAPAAGQTPLRRGEDGRGPGLNSFLAGDEISSRSVGPPLARGRWQARKAGSHARPWLRGRAKLWNGKCDFSECHDHSRGHKSGESRQGACAMGAIWATPLNECGILAIPAGFLSGGYRRALWANARGGDCDYKDLSQFKPSLSLDLLPHRPELPPGSPRQISRATSCFRHRPIEVKSVA